MMASVEDAAESSTKSDSCSFDELCEGANGYVCDPSCLVDLLEGDKSSQAPPDYDKSTQAPPDYDKSTPILVAIKSIKDKLDAIIRVLEIRRGGYVKILHIGKAYIKKRKKIRGEYQPLHRMDPSTWIRSGIGSHWRTQRSKGRDGMIVLTAITRETTPNGINQQEYALKLQQKLIEIYKTETKILGGGEKHTKENPDGYVLYAAFNIEWTRFDVPIANMSTNSMHSSFGFEAAIDNEEEEDDDVQHEPSHVPVIVDNNKDSHPLVISHPPTSEQSSSHTTENTTSLEDNRSQCQDTDLPPTKIQKVSSEDHIDLPLSVTTAESTTTRKPYSSLVGAARPKRSVRKISLAADPKQVPSLSINKLTQGPHVSFPLTRPPSQAAVIPAVEIPPLTPLFPNEAVTPSLDSNAMAALPASIPYTNPPDAVIFGSPPSPPVTPCVPTNVTESPSSVAPSVTFNIPNAATASPSSVAPSVTFNIPNTATASPSSLAPSVTFNIPNTATASPSSVAPSVTFNIPNTATVSPTRAMSPVQQSSQRRQTSVASRTTLGGCTFEDLCNQAELKNYVCDASCLVDLHKTNADEVVQLLVEKLEDNIRELEIARDGQVTKIYIGKTFIKQRRKRGGGHGFQQFDPMQPTTWKKNGISSRWGSHKALGRHGLIVLTAVTRELVPEGLNQQDYALMLEQKLIHHYKLKNDVRLENETSSEGARTKNLARGYALYVAFIIEINDDDSVIIIDGDTDHEEMEESEIFL